MKGGDLLSYAQRAWAKGPLKGKADKVSIPVWYPGIHGIPQRLLRKPSSDSTPKEKALCLIVRMNHMMDYPTLYGLDARQIFFCFPARRFRVVCRSTGPLFSGDRGGGYTPIYAFDTSYASSNNYDWKRALASTLRNFVQFAGRIASISI